MSEAIIYKPFILRKRDLNHIGRANLPVDKNIGLTHLRLSHQIISSLNDSGLIRDFAAFLILKKRYSNSCIFNPTDSKLSAILKVSRQTAMRYRKVFESQEWIKYEHGNMIFKKLTSITNSVKVDYELKINGASNLYLPIGDSIKELVIKLKYLIIKQKEINRDYILKLHQDLTTVGSVEEVQKIKKKLKKYVANPNEEIGEIDYRLQISYKKLSRLLNCSVGSAYNVVKSMCKKEYMKVYSRREILLRGIPDYVWETALKFEEEYTKCFYSNGFVIRIHSNKYNLVL